MLLVHLLLELMSLNHPVVVQLVLNDLLLENVLAESELIDTVDEVLLRDKVALGGFTDASDSPAAEVLVKYDIFKAKELIIAQNDQMQRLD